MKSIGLLGAVLVVACGGSDATIPDGGDDGGGGNDATTKDTGTGDTGATDGGNPADAPTDSPVVDAGKFDVSAVSGLVLWLEADIAKSITLITPDAGPQKVTQWSDQTTHHNDAKGLINNFQARNPSVKAAAINALPAIHFDQSPLTGAGNMLTINDNSDTSLQWGTGDFFVAIVGDFDNDITKGQNLGVGNFFSKASFSGSSSVSGVLLYGNLPSSSVNPTVGMWFNTQSSVGTDSITTSTAYNTLAAHVFSIRRQSSKMDLYVDGTSVVNSTSTGHDVSNSSTPIRIGADGDANLVRLDGDIGEMIAVKGVLSSSDQAGIQAYLKGKWATP